MPRGLGVVDNVALRAKAGAGKDGGGGKSDLDLQDEALLVGGDTDSGCVSGQRNR
jgi:hypothetical protein